MHKIIVGLGFGDESKGATTDWLCATEDIKAVIRYNGGPQAAHNVVQPDGRHHTFSQFGSGSFHGVPTHLSEFMLVNPFNMYREAQQLNALGLGDPFDYTTISRDALLVTPYHRAANRRREDLRGDGRHGSTGQGVGETRWYAREYPVMAPTVGTMKTPYVMNRLLEALRDFYTAELGDLGVVETPEELTRQYLEMTDYMQIVPSEYIDTLLDSGDCVFEGAQGVLLDELYGFNPHTTWTKTTQENARTLLGGREAEVYGLTRTYHTRHGAGPFPTENIDIINAVAPEPHNGTGQYQGAWRVGALDLSLLKYAIEVNGGIDHLCLSHVDLLDELDGSAITAGYITPGAPDLLWPWLGSTELLGAPYTLEQSIALGSEMSNARPAFIAAIEGLDDLVHWLQAIVGVTPNVLSYGPTWKDRVLADVPALS